MYVTLGFSAFSRILERKPYLYCHCMAGPFVSLAFSMVAVRLHSNKGYIANKPFLSHRKYTEINYNFKSGSL